MKGTLTYIVKVRKNLCMCTGMIWYLFSYYGEKKSSRMIASLLFQTDEGTTHEKEDFKLSVNCSSYLVGLPCNGWEKILSKPCRIKSLYSLIFLYSLAQTQVFSFNKFIDEWCNFRDAFAKLLSSGDLTDKYSSQFTTTDTDFPPILAKICFFAHFSGK